MNLAFNGGIGAKAFKRLPVLLKLVAVAWAAWIVAGLFWLATGADRAPLPAPVAVAQRNAAPPVDSSRLSGLNLFGTAQLPGAGDQAANAPDTTLQLRLNGVFVSAVAELSSAIVSESKQPMGKLYRINEALPGGATLDAVFEDRILLKRSDGNTEILRFPKTSLLNGGQASGGAAPGLSSQAGGRQGLNAIGGAPNVRDMLEQAAASLAASPDAYLQQMGLVRSGQGYEVSPNAPAHLIKQSGLRPGDKLVSVNGQPLGDVNRDRLLLQELKNRGQARIEVQRGAQTLTINQNF